ncbi:PREDICTED: uncharacterized protein LOC109235998 [Nicotiana attenuata]|uniref:uncharacterized protein LOC109208758 n=1 Tax=Nicotiana attenuata TaxID=49451 RepID=UPI000904E030|nr:PREDICTED: uncharacterized protein LOC109208758 [Nicotiana attenuata]XP_019257781.1 PREDICTED: uncharacterized protein LOC109235998 [Nicotiana attenuata]
MVIVRAVVALVVASSWLEKYLQEKFKMKDLGELKFFLGIEFSRSKEGILMCQRKYALKVVSELGLAGGKQAPTPLEFSQKLTYVEFDEVVKDSDSEVCNLKRRKIIKVQLLSQYMHAPKASHMEAARRIVKYIKSTPGLDLFMPSGSCNRLIAYCDFDWGACVELRRSVTGYVVKFGEALIS